MLTLDLLAERRIAEAIARGDFDDLPGTGRPLELDDDPLIPNELRAAYRILKNAGFVPPEVAARREIGDLAAWVVQAEAGPARSRSLARLQFLRMKLALSRPDATLPLAGEYSDSLCARLGRED